MGKHCRSRSDTAVGSPLFAFKVFYQNLNRNGKETPNTPKIGNERVLLVRVGGSIQLIWVNLGIIIIISYDIF